MYNDTASTHAGDDLAFDERRFLEGLAEIAALPSSDLDESFGSDQLDMIEKVIQQLPAPLPDRWLAAAWATAHSIIQEDWRVAALALLAFHAHTERQDDLYQVVFDLLRSIEYAAPPLGYMVFAALPDRYLDTARAIAQALPDEWDRQYALEVIDDRTTEASHARLTLNQERAQRARSALQAFIATDTSAYRDEDTETQMSDLLCDLHHLADQLGLDWHQILTRAERYSTQETQAQGEEVHNLERRERGRCLYARPWAPDLLDRSIAPSGYIAHPQEQQLSDTVLDALLAQAIGLGLLEPGSEEITLDFQDHFETLGYTFLSCASAGEHFIAALDAHSPRCLLCFSRPPRTPAHPKQTQAMFPKDHGLRHKIKRVSAYARIAEADTVFNGDIMPDNKPRMDPRLAQRLDEKKAELDRYRPLSPATVAYINEQLRVLLTYHSNAIEGNTLSLRETQLVIEHGITVGGHSLREHLEATNHAQAFAYLTDLVSRAAPITREVILTLNRLVIDKLIDTPGAFRSGPVSIRGARLRPPAAAEVPKLMREWIAWIDNEGQSYHPVLRATIAHHGFEAVHPFRDGNGRTGRLLMNLILMQAGYPPALLLQEWRLAYLEALSVADTGRFGPLANLIGRAVEQGLDLYLEACEHTPVSEEAGEQLLSELAHEFGYSTDYLSLLIRKGRLAGTKRGPRWYSTRAAIERYQREVAQGLVARGRPRGSSKR